MMPEVPADKAMTDLIAASEEELRDSEVVPECSPGMASFFFFFLLSVPLFANILLVFLSADLP